MVHVLKLTAMVQMTYVKVIAIMHKEGVDVSITGNSTNPTRFQHPVAGTYKKECIEQGKKYFSVALVVELDVLYILITWLLVLLLMV